MARKTNKTAHVLNLISKAKDEHQAMEEQMEIDNTGSDVSNDLLFMGIEPSNDKSISEKINENLESLAKNEEEPPAKEPETTNTQSTDEEGQTQTTKVDVASAGTDSPEKNSVKAEEPDKIESSQSAVESQPTETKPIPTEPVTEPALTTKSSEEPAVETPPEPNFHYLNVYENLVNERLEEFQTMFDVCTCQRCTADVAALALTNLPSKYIVTDNAKTIPLLSFYREKFKSSVAAQLSSACIVVKEHPYH